MMPTRTKWRSCEGKKAHETRADAKSTIHSPRPSFHAYHCKHCDKWHTGHVGGRRRKR